MRLAHLPILKPEMCSYDPGSMNWANSYIFANSPSFLERLGTLCQKEAIKPECEVFDGGMMGNIEYYMKKGFLATPIHYQFVLGVSGGMPGNADSLAYLLPKMLPGSTWSITGIGRDHLPCMLLGLAEGCDGLRVGLEDNIFLEKGVLATNAQLVERACKLGELAGRTIATAADAREILGLTNTSKQKRKGAHCYEAGIDQTDRRFGRGHMGPGIAQRYAMSGRSVNLYDISEQALEKAKVMLRTNLDTFVEEELLTAEEADGVFAGSASPPTWRPH